MEKVIVTRHPALVEFLREQGIVGEVVSHATEDTVKGKHVFGVLPMRLASLCGRFTEVSLTVPAELRGKELTLEDIKGLNPTLTEWVVRRAEEFVALTDLLPPENTAGAVASAENEGWLAVNLGRL